jgi:hypothetical protein
MSAAVQLSEDGRRGRNRLNRARGLRPIRRSNMPANQGVSGPEGGTGGDTARTRPVDQFASSA